MQPKYKRTMQSDIQSFLETKSTKLCKKLTRQCDAT
jgi:hypothetical protein